jgi:hypothetical protein
VALEGSGVRYSARCGTSGAQTFQVVASDGVNEGAPATGTVTVAANPCPQPPGPLGKAPLPSIRPTTVRPDTKRRVSFKLTCARSAPGRCAGKLVIKTTKVRTSVKTKVRKVVTVVRSRSYSIAAGTALSWRVTLPKAAAAALRLAKGGKVPLRATLTATKSATFSANSTTRTLTLRARRR